MINISLGTWVDLIHNLLSDKWYWVKDSIARPIQYGPFDTKKQCCDDALEKMCKLIAEKTGCETTGSYDLDNMCVKLTGYKEVPLIYHSNGKRVIKKSEPMAG